MEEKIRTTETKVYVAFDGREFNDKRNCQVYEMKEASKNIALGNNVIEAVGAKGMPPYDGDVHDADYWTYRWFYIKNERGVDELIAAFPDSSDCKLSQALEWVGRWVCLECECNDGDGCAYAYPLSETLDYLKNLHAALSAALEPKTITEFCSECEHEVTLEWDISKQGYKAFCPYCGARLMLCDECRHRNGGYCDDCDYCAETDSCRFNKPETK